MTFVVVCLLSIDSSPRPRAHFETEETLVYDVWQILSIGSKQEFGGGGVPHALEPVHIMLVNDMV